MHKPYDVTTKGIIDLDPMAWVQLLKMPGTSAELLDTDLSTSKQADRLIRVKSEPDYILNPELISSYKPDHAENLFYYNVLARINYKLSVQSVAVLLRPQANGPNMNGLLEIDSIRFGFTVLHLWEIPVEDLLGGSIALLPLAAISKVTVQQLPSVLVRIRDRVRSEVPDLAKKLLTATETLLGLSHDPSEVKELVEGVWSMQDWIYDSSVVQESLNESRAEGRAEGKEEIVSLQLQRRFSTLSDGITVRLDRLSPDQMNELAIALLDFNSLSDLEDWLASHE